MAEKIKQSKSIEKLKKGDKVTIDGNVLEIDAHYVFMKHENTTEMIIELFNPKTEKEYQLRYFNDQIESSIEFYYLQGELQYVRADVKSIEW